MKLYEKREVLREEEAGGHGDKWLVFSGEPELFVGEIIPKVVENSQLIPPPESGEDGEEPPGWLLKYPQREGCGIVAVIAREGEEGRYLTSMYPECEGLSLPVRIESIELFPHELEARLVALPEGLEKEITFFDTRFLYQGKRYEDGRLYRAKLALLAYEIEAARSDPIVIDDPLQIEKYHARLYWVEKYGIYEKSDEERALELYRREAEISHEPIVIPTDDMSIWIEDNPYRDEVYFQGRVEKVIDEEIELLGARFRCYHISILFDSDEKLLLPCYVHTEHVAKEAKFAPGEMVRGYGWVHGYVEL